MSGSCDSSTDCNMAYAIVGADGRFLSFQAANDETNLDPNGYTTMLYPNGTTLASGHTLFIANKKKHKKQKSKHTNKNKYKIKHTNKFWEVLYPSFVSQTCQQIKTTIV